jgi:hypothetical protein
LGGGEEDVMHEVVSISGSGAMLHNDKFCMETNKRKWVAAGM